MDLTNFVTIAQHIYDTPLVHFGLLVRGGTCTYLSIRDVAAATGSHRTSDNAVQG